MRPEKLVQFEDTWSKQMFEAVSEDLAIEDVMFELDRALQEERLALPLFLKEIRKLAHRQFQARALALKIRGLQQERAAQGSSAIAQGAAQFRASVSGADS